MRSLMVQASDCGTKVHEFESRNLKMFEMYSANSIIDKI